MEILSKNAGCQHQCLEVIVNRPPPNPDVRKQNCSLKAMIFLKKLLLKHIKNSVINSQGPHHPVSVITKLVSS